MSERFDIAVVGGGLVGLATAMALAAPPPWGTRSGQGGARRRLVLLEGEDRLAAHQSGNNSGVIHSGLYYEPGSLKAQTCTEGREDLYRFCAEHEIRHERCGKLVVALSEEEVPRLDELERRGRANGLVGLRRLSAAELQQYEPHVAGMDGLYVPDTGIVDYPEVARTYARRIEEGEGEVRTGWRVTKIRRDAAGGESAQGEQPGGGDLVLETSRGAVRCGLLINCAGAWSDRLARLAGVDPGARIVPFRGEYYDLRPDRRHLVKNLIYPVPDPRFPFLGVHFTRTVFDGQVEAGPNAVLALARDGYSWGQVNLRDSLETLSYFGFWRLAARHAVIGCGEVYRSLSRAAFVRALRRLIPELEDDDVEPGGAGVRAQALDSQGRLLDDFHIVRAQRMVHVLNAPSPGATASIAIGRQIAAMIDE